MGFCCPDLIIYVPQTQVADCVNGILLNIILEPVSLNLKAGRRIFLKLPEDNITFSGNIFRLLIVGYPVSGNFPGQRCFLSTCENGLTDQDEKGDQADKYDPFAVKSGFQAHNSCFIQQFLVAAANYSFRMAPVLPEVTSLL